MAPQKFNIFQVMSEAQEIEKSHSRRHKHLYLLFMIPFSFCIQAYPTLQYSLSPPHQTPVFHLQFPFNEDLIIFNPLSLFVLYHFTLLCLSVCAIGTITYALYHGFFAKPVEIIYAPKSLSNSLIRLFATFICADAIILAGLVGIRLIVLGVTRTIEYIGCEIQYDSICFRIFKVLGCVILIVGVLYLCVDWILTPAIVVGESSWGPEALRRSACLVKENRGIAARLWVSTCAMIYLCMMGFGSFGQFLPFGSSVYISILVAVIMAIGSYALSTHLLRCLIATTILYQNCKALQGVLPEEIKADFISLPLDEEKAPHNIV